MASGGRPADTGSTLPDPSAKPDGGSKEEWGGGGGGRRGRGGGRFLWTALLTESVN